jgi:hypothetical protein
MRSVRRFVLSLCFILLTYTGAQAAELVPFVRVPAEESGLTHVVKQRTKEESTAMVTWISATTVTTAAAQRSGWATVTAPLRWTARTTNPVGLSVHGHRSGGI